MEIKTSPEQLGKLFAQSAANENLPQAERQFAARLVILTAHIDNLYAQLAKEIKARKGQGMEADKTFAELANHIVELKKGLPAVAATPPASTEAPAEQQQETAEEAPQEDLFAESKARAEAAFAAQATKVAKPKANPTATENAQ